MVNCMKKIRYVIHIFEMKLKYSLLKQYNGHSDIETRIQGADFSCGVLSNEVEE